MNGQRWAPPDHVHQGAQTRALAARRRLVELTVAQDDPLPTTQQVTNPSGADHDHHSVVDDLPLVGREALRECQVVGEVQGQVRHTVAPGDRERDDATPEQPIGHLGQGRPDRVVRADEGGGAVEVEDAPRGRGLDALVSKGVDERQHGIGGDHHIGVNKDDGGGRCSEHARPHRQLLVSIGQLQDLDAGHGTSDVSRPVGRSIGNHYDVKVGAVRLHQGPEESADHAFLVVGRNHDGSDGFPRGTDAVRSRLSHGQPARTRPRPVRSCGPKDPRSEHARELAHPFDDAVVGPAPIGEQPAPIVASTALGRPGPPASRSLLGPLRPYRRGYSTMTGKPHPMASNWTFPPASR